MKGMGWWWGKEEGVWQGWVGEGGVYGFVLVRNWPQCGLGCCTWPELRERETRLLLASATSPTELCCPSQNSCWCCSLYSSASDSSTRQLRRCAEGRKVLVWRGVKLGWCRIRFERVRSYIKGVRDCAQQCKIGRRRCRLFQFFFWSVSHSVWFRVFVFLQKKKMLSLAIKRHNSTALKVVCVCYSVVDNLKSQEHLNNMKKEILKLGVTDIWEKK